MGLQGPIGPAGPTGPQGPAGVATIYLMSGTTTIATNATHNFSGVIGGYVAAANNEANLQMPLQFDCAVQNVKVHFQTAPSATVNTAKFFDIFLRKNGANTSTTCRIESTATDCTMAVNTAITNLTDLINWDLVPNQTGTQPASPGFASITGVCK